MTAFLPPNLLALFAARDPIPYITPPEKLGFEKKRVPYGGVASLLKEFEDPKDTPPPTRVETKDERKERKRKERAEQIAYKLEQDLALWDPTNTLSGTSDPYKTLFVARINYDTSESKLRREFEVYGPIRKISLVHDKFSMKPRGYAFIEYEHERDMHSAYKHADGKKIDGRRVLVDVERGRTVKGWQPRRLGGGLGGTRKGGPDENTRFSGRDEYSGSYRDRESRREMSPVRDRGDRGDRDRERPRRRSRSRDRERRRSRSRDRERRRSRSRDRGEEVDRKRSKRSRSRDRKRSRSKERKRGRRSRSRDRRRSRDREDRRPEEGGGGDADYNEEGEIRIKSEPNRPGYGEENLQNFNGNEEQYNDEGNEGYENQDQVEPVNG